MTLSELEMKSRDVISRLKNDDDFFIMNDNEYYFCCGLMARYILDRTFIINKKQKQYELASLTKITYKNTMRVKINRMIRYHYVNHVKKPHILSDHLASAILMYEPQSSKVIEEDAYFIHGRIRQEKWYNK